jgi:hypothetical protein
MFMLVHDMQEWLLQRYIVTPPMPRCMRMMLMTLGCYVYNLSERSDHLGHAGGQEDGNKGEYLPAPSSTKDHPHKSRKFLPSIPTCLALTGFALFYVTYGIHLPQIGGASKTTTPDFVTRGLAKCEAIKLMPPDTTSFRVNRTVSDRFEPNNAKPNLLKNATVWTGGDNGEEVLFGASIYLKGGVVVSVGTEKEVRRQVADHAEEVDVEG